MKNVMAVCFPFTIPHLFVGYALQCCIFAVREYKTKYLKVGEHKLLVFEGVCKDYLTKIFMQAPSAFSHKFSWLDDKMGEVVRFRVSSKNETWVFNIDLTDLSYVTLIGSKGDHRFDPYQIVFDSSLESHEIRFVHNIEE